MTATIVTVLHGSARELAALLASIERRLPGTPLVVVDTGPDDGGADLARAAGATVVERRDNPGFGAANNAGLAHVGTPVTILLNPDTVLLDGGLAELVALATRSDALFAPRLVDAAGDPERSAHPLPGTTGALLAAPLHPPVLPRPLRDRLEPWRADRARSVGWAIAACLVARTDTLRALGPFDPSIFLFFEDMDLCLRARARGIRTVFVPSVTVRHLGRHSTGPEDHAVQVRRRHDTVGTTLGPAAARRDDAAQLLTFASRVAARRLLRRPATREAAQLAAQRGGF